MPASWGGVEQHVHHLVHEIADENTQAVVYTRPHYTPKEVVAEFNTANDNIRLVSIPSTGTKHLDTILYTLLATLHAIVIEKPGIFHFHSVGPSLLSWLPRLFRPSARVVTTFHSPDRLHQKWNWFARKVLTCGEWTATHIAHKTIAVSRDLQEYAENRFSKPVVYIPNGVELSQWLKPSMITAEYGLTENDYLLVVSRLVRHKGVHYLIEAFKKIKTTKKLVIVGDSAATDDYVAELKRQAQDDDRIIFTGYQSGRMLEELFSNCALYVHPSESEGLSIALLEAASYGCGILASDIGPNREVVQGRGFLFRNKSAKDLKEQLEYIMVRPKEVEEAGKVLRQFVSAEYNWEEIGKETRRLYGSLYELPLPSTSTVTVK